MDRDRTTRWLFLAGVAGPLLFVLVFLVEGALRPGYDPATTFVSQLSLGDRGWIQIASLLVSGALILAFAVGLRRALDSGPGSRWGPVMVAVVGLGLVIAGIFPTDPAQGYPPGTPPGPTSSYSWRGGIHLVGALFVFGGLPIAAFVFARRFRAIGDGAWAIYSLVTGVAMPAVFVAASAGANGSAGLAGVAGWLQRASIVIGFAWIALLAVPQLRDMRRPLPT